MANIDIMGRAPRPSFYLNEGQFTRDDDLLTDQGPAKGGKYASQMSVGDEVQIDTAKDNCVAPLTNGIPIGRIANRPEVQVLPRATTAFADLTDQETRIAALEIDGTIVRIKLKASNQAITPGTYLGVSSGDEYDKEEDTTTNVVALETRSANAGGYIRAFRKGNAPSQKVAD